MGAGKCPIRPLQRVSGLDGDGFIAGQTSGTGTEDSDQSFQADLFLLQAAERSANL